MTRVLSKLLDAREPEFQQSLRQLERLAGHPSADIRLSTAVQTTLRDKLCELHLDGSDTTGPELYAALGQRLQQDELRFVAALQAGTTDASTDSLAQLVQALRQQLEPRSSFAVRPSTARSLLRANLPRKTMKVLGYRSADSMLRHESVAALMAAASLLETTAWAKRMHVAYGRLRSSDFETRQLTIEYPSSRRWQELAETIAERRQQVISFKEHGAVVVLPLPTETGQHAAVRSPALPVLTAAVLIIHAVNDICAAGTYLKLHQMQADFGSLVQQVIHGDTILNAGLSTEMDSPLSWQALHQYVARFGRAAQAEIFEPVIAAEELAWHSVEQVLEAIEPAMIFWQHTPYLGLLQEGRAVSCNITDMLLSHCNRLPFEQRIVAHFQQALRGEILLQYLRHDKLEQIVFGALRQQLAPEMATL